MRSPVGSRVQPALVLVAALVPLVSPTSRAEDDEAGRQPDEEPVELFERLTVNEGLSELGTVPGSAHYLDEATLREQSYDDIHRILRRVPGINIQEEEGYGLRPNIGMRGTGTERSSKITVMEDGVLIAPAPYAAPSAYYFPTTGRMQGIEVRKGSSSIRQGPYTNGGALNLMSTEVPVELSGRVNAGLGEDSLYRVHAHVGGTHGRYGWLLETYQLDTEGYKELDGGGDTGVDLGDYVGKFRITSKPGADVYQAFELKLGRTDQFGDETYLGITDDDFDSDPLRRYAASQNDVIDTEHEQIVARWMIQPTARLDFTTHVYRNDFFRNWYKLQSVNGSGLGGVFTDPVGHADELAILRGELTSDDDALKIRANRRDYYSQGIETVAGLHFGRRARHELEIGLRYHEDEEDRFQEEDGFRMEQGGAMVQTSFGAPGSQANRIAQAEAVALFVRDTIEAGRWTLTPGVRFETIDFERLDYGKSDPDRTGASLTERLNDTSVVIPGMGVAYEIREGMNVFGGIHRGFAPPGPGKDEDTDAEDSVNYEIGFRHTSRTWQTSIAAFYNDYSNLLGADTLASGGDGDGDLFNGGEVRVVGLEAAIDYDLKNKVQSRVGLPIGLTYTYTDAEFQNTFESDFDAWGDVTAGDELPYLPEQQWSARFGVVGERWRGDLVGSYVDEMRTVAGSGAIPELEGTDSNFVVDLSTRLSLPSRVDLVLQVRNLLDEEYIVARRPAGARPGLPRRVSFGIDWRF